MDTDTKAPDTLWLLPILFGFLGGLIAAWIAGIKYKDRRRGYLVVGAIVNGLVWLVSITFLASLF